MPIGTNIARPIYPRFINEGRVMQDLRILKDALERRDRQVPIFPANVTTGFQVTNGVDTWDLDATGSTADTVRKVLGTLITYLQNNGTLR